MKRLYMILSTLLTLTAIEAIPTSGALPAFQATMVKNGAAQVTLVLRDSAGNCTKLAADDLSKYLGKALGVEVPVVNHLADVKTPFSILLGNDFGVGFDASLDDLGRDGYVIKTHGSSMLICGPSDYGTACGVYSFLMDYIGVRWFAPGELYEDVPHNPDLAWPNLNVKESPKVSIRTASGVMGKDGANWLRRSRFITDGSNLPYYGLGHNLENIFQPSIYSKDHPEYYAMIDGKRRIPDKDKDTGIQPCFSNPDIVQIAAKAADEFFKKNPKSMTFSLCINDNIEFCRCPECSRLDSPQRYSKGGWPIYSDSYFHFVTEVAKIVAQTNPDKAVSCYAYWGVELTPRHIKELPDNVVIALTQDTSQHFDSQYKKADRELWLQWSKVSKHLLKYDYYGLGWLTPRHFPTLAAEDIKFFTEHGGMGFYSETYPNWPINAPQVYLASRLLWNPSLDPKALLGDYFTTLYGAAAPEMEQFNSIMERYWAQPRKGKWFQGLENIHAEMDMANEPMIEEAWQLLQKAKSKATGIQLKRLQDAEGHFQFTYAIVKGSCLCRELTNMKIADKKDANLATAKSTEALAMLKLAEDTYRNIWQPDPLYKTKYYDGFKFDLKFSPWKEEMQKAADSAMDKAKSFGAVLPEEQ